MSLIYIVLAGGSLPYSVKTAIKQRYLKKYMWYGIIHCIINKFAHVTRKW